MASVKLIIMLIYCIQQKNIQRELLHFILETFVVVKKFSPFKIVIGRLANNVLDIMWNKQIIVWIQSNSSSSTLFVASF